MSIKEFTFPANQTSSGFTIEVDIRSFCQDVQFIGFSLIRDSLYLHYNGGFPQSAYHRILGWNRQPFPTVCGLDIVCELYQYDPRKFTPEIWEKWWQWAGGVFPRIPAIGIIPQIINERNQIALPEPQYSWFVSKGTKFGIPFKNINYPNHVLQSYLFMPFKETVKEQILNPKFGMILR